MNTYLDAFYLIYNFKTIYELEIYQIISKKVQNQLFLTKQTLKKTDNGELA